MAICLEEVDRCARTTERPNFLLLLGDRLGWHPLPAEIQADLLADLGRLLGGDPAHARAAELLNEWYGHTRDDNAVPPVHHLGPAERAAADEVTLRRALESVLGDVTPEVHATLVGGATEQEVRRRLALGPIDGGRAVIAIRQIRDLPDSPEATAFADLDAGGRPDGSARSRHRKLQTELESVAGVDRLAYEARWLGSDISSTHIESLCNDVHDRLSVAIRSELSPPTGAGPHAREDGLHSDRGHTVARLPRSRGGADSASNMARRTRRPAVGNPRAFRLWQDDADRPRPDKLDQPAGAGNRGALRRGDGVVVESSAAAAGSVSPACRARG